MALRLQTRHDIGMAIYAGSHNGVWELYHDNRYFPPSKLTPIISGLSRYNGADWQDVAPLNTFLSTTYPLEK